MKRLVLSGGPQFNQLLAGVLRQIAPQATNARVMLIEHLEFLETGQAARQHFPILLQYSPVAWLDACLVEKAPCIALPAADLADAPEEVGGCLFVDRRCIGDDAEVSAGAG